MNSPLSLSWILRIAAGAALVGVLIGGGWAAYDVLTSTWVLEFQAGQAAPVRDRAIAIAQRAAIEGVGFGLVGGVLAAFALGFTRLRARLRNLPVESHGQELAASLVLVTAAFVGWVSVAQLADDALPFLRPGALFLLNLSGFVAAIAAFSAYDWIVRRLPRTPRDAHAGVALASSVCAGIACVQALEIVKGVSGGYRSPARLAMAAGCFVLGLIAAVVIANLLRGTVRWMGRRLQQGRVVPRLVTAPVGALLVIAILASVPTFRLSAVGAAVEYANLAGPEGGGSRPNVVFVTIDTLRADHLGCYGYERPTSPTMDAIAAEGTLFEDPSAAAAWTKPATGTILTGLYPSRHGALYHGSTLRLPEGERTLAEAFRDSGYVTAGFVSNPNLKKVFLFDRGFDEYFDSPVEDTITLASIRGAWFGQILMKLMRHQFNWKYENDVSQMNEHIFAWLEHNTDDPFFLYLHYIDPHIPYTPPSPYLEDFSQDHGLVFFNERSEKVGLDLYDGEIRYMDEGMKHLVDELKRHGLWEDTLLVVTSDHGEEFFEHGVLGHGFSLYQPVIGVPVFVRGPGVAAGRRVSDPVQVLDLPATMLDLAGTGVTELGDGHSFADAARAGEWSDERLVYLENEFGQDDSDHRSFVFKGVRKGPWKLVLTEENAYFPPQYHGRQALYNLAEDPDEQVNLIESEEVREVVGEMLEGLMSHTSFLNDTGFREYEPAAIDPATEESLRALGYLGGD